MAWTDRLREAAYTSPSGVRIVFGYEDVRRSVTRKTTAFEFPDADGTFIQDLGTAGHRYPLRVFFWGADCDLEATAFEDALTESGVGKLEHPIYGIVDVTPFGEIVRRDDLKTAANQAVVQVVFWETTGLVYPSAQGDPGSEVLDAVDGYNDAAAESFAATPGIDSAVGQAGLKGQYERHLAAVSTALAPIAATQEDVAARFQAIDDSINLGIDVLVSQPLTLAFQTILLIQTPARAVAAIADRLNAYAGLLSSLIRGEGAAGGVQEFQTTDVFASAQVSAMVISVVDTVFLTKTGAIQAAEVILAQFETLTVWRDDNFEALAAVDSGEAYQQLQNAVALAAGFLVELSFSLKQERSLTIDQPRTIVDLAAELYGAVDSELDFLITSNNLTGSEILELPRGRDIVWYI